MRRLLPLFLSVPFCVPLFSCASTGGPPPGVVVGEELLEQPTVAFVDVNAEPAAYYDRTLLVEATVTAVCQSKGCWTKIEDGDASAMVRWEDGCDGRYAFPEDSVGKRVLIQGSFYPKTISEEDAQHLESESDVPIERETYEFNASAILVLEG